MCEINLHHHRCKDICKDLSCHSIYMCMYWCVYRLCVCVLLYLYAQVYFTQITIIMRRKYSKIDEMDTLGRWLIVESLLWWCLMATIVTNPAAIANYNINPWGRIHGGHPCILHRHKRSSSSVSTEIETHHIIFYMYSHQHWNRFLFHARMMANDIAKGLNWRGWCGSKWWWWLHVVRLYPVGLYSRPLIAASTTILAVPRVYKD